MPCSKSTGAPGRMWSLLAATALAAGCGGEDPVEPDNAPPDLTGTYTLVSISALVTGGEVLTPPDASGSFVLQQSPPVGDQASGTMTMSITIPDGLGGTTTIGDAGTYTVRSDGTWEQTGELVQAKGTFALVGNTLSVEVTEPVINVSTTVWQRR